MLTFQPDSDQTFWDAIRDDLWEQHPAALRFRQGTPPLTLDDVFEAVTRAPFGRRNGRFWVARDDAPALPSDFAQPNLDLLGPQVLDGDFAGFFARMADYSFGINIHALGAAVPEFRALVETFARQLSEVPGAATAQSWLADTFFGNYRATPFGIHRDPAGVFSFLLQGSRTYAFWPPGAFATDHPDLLRPDAAVLARHLGTAEVFHAEPGDLIYWPSNRWHVMLSDGRPFVAAQVSAYFKPEDVGQLPPAASGE